MYAIAALVALLLTVGQVTPDKAAILGGWTLNKELSDAPVDRSAGGERGDGRGHGRGHGGGGGRGGYGGGGFGAHGPGGTGQGGPSPDDLARMRDAVRELTDPSDHLTIADTGSIIIITGADGRTARLSPDGTKIKDDNTKIERKTKWDGGRLVTEISGVGSGKATQTVSVDPETHRLHLTVQMQGGRSGQAPRTITHIYDPDAR